MSYDESSKNIEGMVTVDKVMFSAKDSNYKVLSVQPVNLYQGKELVEVSKEYNNFVITGNAPDNLSYTDEYKVVLTKEDPHPQYGQQIKIVYMSKPVDLDDKKSQVKFLESFLTEKQIESMYDTLDNPFKAIQDGDVDSLIKCKGIGESTALSILRRYDETKDYSSAFVALYDYGLTNNMIQLLSDSYGSPDIAVEKIKSNPYLLATEVKGIGFKKADEIAMSQGVSELSSERITAFISSFMFEQASLGYSWVTPNVLFGNMATVLDIDPSKEEVEQAMVSGLHHLRDRGLIWHNEDRTQIALKHVMEVEREVAKELVRINEASSNFEYEGWEDVIKRTEEFQGWEFTEQQQSGIQTVLENNVSIITGYGGCVDKDTEFFNGIEWKPISEYVEGDKVLQFNEDRAAELVEPLEFVKYPEKYFTEIQTEDDNLNQLLSWEHNVVYENAAGALQKKSLHEVVGQHNKQELGFDGKFLTTFNYDNEGVDIADETLFVVVDNVLGYESKSLGDFMPMDEWYSLSGRQLKAIVEWLAWGKKGNHKNLSIKLSCKKSIDFLQFAFATVGMMAVVDVYDEVYELFVLDDSSKLTIAAESVDEKLEFKQVKSKDGYKYCFEVPSGMLVLRREGRIFVTGNTGKTSIVSGMLDVLRGYSFIQGALAGKAGARLAEVTGEDGHTIHRMLGFNPRGGYKHDSDNPLIEDIIIIDELSMVGADIFKDLLKAVKNGAKLVMLCDIGQLESIGMGNVAVDIIQSGVIPVVNLTQIHRQAEKSAIISTSLKVRKGEQIAHREGHTTLGELQDLVIDIHKEREGLKHKLIETFKEEYEKVDRDVMEIQVVVPMRSRGELSTESLNAELQQICNPEKSDFLFGEGKDEDGSDEITITLSKDVKKTLRVGDKVINNKNNYLTKNREGEVTPVFNGDTGIVVRVDHDKEELQIDFIRIGIILIPFTSIRDIDLAYALTCHKCQGSEYKSVLVGLDYSAYMLLSREWVYTAITRAQEHCVLIAELGALQQAIQTSSSMNKQTFLQQFLKEEYNQLCS